MKNENMNNYSDEPRSIWNRFGTLILSAIVCLALIAYIVIGNINEKKFGKTVSIQKYNTLEKRVDYLYYCNTVKTQILYDVLVTGKMDSAFVLSVSNHIPSFVIDSKNKGNVLTNIPDKKLLAHQIDSVCANWYESIPFTYMDAKHDSAWVLKSNTYKSTKELVNSLRNKK